MRFAICNELYNDRDPRAAMQHARSLGYQGWEIAPFTLSDSVEDFSQPQRKQYAQMAADQGLEIVGLHWLLAKTTGFHLTHDDPAVRTSTANYLGLLATLCHDLGGKVMVLGSPRQRNLSQGVSMAEGIDRAAEVLGAVSDQLADQNVTIAVEPLGPEETNFLCTAAQGQSLVDAVGSPQVNLLLDVKAMSTESIPIPNLISSHIDSLVHFHANDPNRQGPGMGDVDFRPIIKTLKDENYGGWVSVEVFDYSPGIEKLASTSIEYLTSLLQH